MSVSGLEHSPKMRISAEDSTNGDVLNFKFLIIKLFSLESRQNPGKMVTSERTVLKDIWLKHNNTMHSP